MLVPEPDCDSTEELIDVLVRMAHRQVGDLDCLKHAVFDEQTQVGENVLALVLLGRVVELQFQYRGHRTLFLNF